MSKTDTEDRHLANELFDLMIRFTHSVGVSRTITQENAIGIHRKNFFGGVSQGTTGKPCNLREQDPEGLTS